MLGTLEWMSCCHCDLSLFCLAGSSHNDKAKGLGKGLSGFVILGSLDTMGVRGNNCACHWFCFPGDVLFGEVHFTSGLSSWRVGSVYTSGWSIQAVSWSSESWGREDPLSWVETEAVLCFLVCWCVSSPPGPFHLHNLPNPFTVNSSWMCAAGFCSRCLNTHWRRECR